MPEKESSISAASPKAGRALLIVSKTTSVARELRALLRAQYDDIHTTSDPIAAEVALRDNPNIEHLACGVWLGSEWPSGHELIANWRRRYPHIAFAVLLTEDLPPDGFTMPAVDEVLCVRQALRQGFIKGLAKCGLLEQPCHHAATV